MSAKHRKIARRGTTVLVATTAMALVSGTALAYWTTSGGGNGTATAGTASPLGVGTASVSGLYPSTSVAGSVTVTNSNPFPVEITGVAFGTVTVDTQHAEAGCTAAGVSFSATGLPATVPKKTASDGSMSLGFTVTMTNASPSPCQGATFTSSYTFTAASK